MVSSWFGMPVYECFLMKQSNVHSLRIIHNMMLSYTSLSSPVSLLLPTLCVFIGYLCACEYKCRQTHTARQENVHHAF